ncbi:MAG: hypothetical protein J6U54_14175 [Clostridiales bacterium]|nr:hypothetical protein [Clostridiales bacterium]
MDSILGTIKKMIGGSAEGYEHFDTDLIVHINTAISIVNQLGVGTDNFYISDDTATWSEFYDGPDLNMIQTYIYLRVRQLFDPPTGGGLSNSIQDQIDMLEWRINVQGDKTASRSS